MKVNFVEKGTELAAEQGQRREANDGPREEGHGAYEEEASNEAREEIRATELELKQGMLRKREEELRRGERSFAAF